MTQEEIDYYHSKISPEERYQTMKEMYYFHDSSSYMKSGDNRADNYGCNSDVCISECDFYPETGRIEDDGSVTHPNGMATRTESLLLGSSYLSARKF